MHNQLGSSGGGGGRNSGRADPERPSSFHTRHCLQDVREKATQSLVHALVKNQQEFEAESGAEQSEEDEAAAATALGGARAREVSRALRRCSPLLVRVSLPYYAFPDLPSSSRLSSGPSIRCFSHFPSLSAVLPAPRSTPSRGCAEGWVPAGRARGRASAWP